MRIIFMGTPQFAVPALQACIHSGYRPVLCVSQPDRPQGRKQICVPTPVKLAAQEAGIPVYQPTKVRDAAFVQTLMEYEPDLIVTAAYGRILTRQVLELPRLGAINVHGSLLPRYRGASPVQMAIWNQDAQTGVTILEMTEELDAGRILLQEALSLHGTETTEELMFTLGELGGRLLPRALRGLEEGILVPMDQDPAQVVHTHLITKEHGLICFDDSAAQIDAIVRACTPWPGAWATYEGKRVRLLRTRVVSENEAKSVAPADVTAVKMAPGFQCAAPRQRIWIQTGSGILEIVALQKQGGKALQAADCAHNFPAGIVWQDGSEVQ